MRAVLINFNNIPSAKQTSMNWIAKTGIHSSANLKLIERIETKTGDQAGKTVLLSGKSVQTPATAVSASTEQPLPVQNANDAQLLNRDGVMIAAMFMMGIYFAMSSPVITSFKNRIIHRAKNLFGDAGNHTSQNKKQMGQ